MYRKRVSLLAAAAVCVALALLSTPRLAEAEQPETVEITFGLWVPYDGQLQPPELPYYVGEDTLVILIRELLNPYGGFAFADVSFAVGQFDDVDGEIEVAGTYWMRHARATIVNMGGPIDATVFVNAAPGPPAHYPLIFHEITEVHTSWITEHPSTGKVYVQEFCDQGGLSVAVFIIVTGEFRVKQ